MLAYSEGVGSDGRRAPSTPALLLAWLDGPPTRITPYAAFVNQSESCCTVSLNAPASLARQSTFLPRRTGYNGWANS